MRVKYNIAVPSFKGVSLETQEGVLISLITKRGIKDVGFHYRYENQVVCVATDIESGMSIAKGDNIMKCALLARTRYNSKAYIKNIQNPLYQACVRSIRVYEESEGE